jgi:threonine synthase
MDPEMAKPEAAIPAKGLGMWPGVIRRYAEFLPVSESTPVVTLLEGNTPLLRADNLAGVIGCPIPIYLKCEGFNPTGSFKDRGMTVAVSKAKEEGAEAVLCASTGNTAASAAAYAAKGNLRCMVLIPRGYVALGKLAQSVTHGARVIAVEGTFDDCLPLARALTERFAIVLVNSINPNRIAGQQTASFEICDVLGRPPVYHAMPVGNAGNITAYWKGYKAYKAAGKIDSLPLILGFQAEGAAPIVLGHPVEKPDTVATAIRIGNPASWKTAVEARDESRGLIDMVSDDEIIEAYKLLASREGVFVDPASAASVAGLAKLIRQGYFARHGDGGEVVCTLTGHGLKDPETAMRIAPEARVVAPDLDTIARALEL